ncbi:DUF2147 domain-containing protein [Caulobacter sp. NIBR1757]|uniref:DUF2147 domain-containing protein n=1 Tax=Caulobacter sp. NIBR1757 TaxID=3016000 RepID=UPI0022F0979E|nr:DUF2147 domain-containing protein [Caulobacter sp. NIBR1757]WGM41001.1 hypothetical protein AMEJIAPC_03948 [Caulobacter sp. NIBR1757]
MLSTLIALALSAAAPADGAHGLWKTPSGGQIRMAPCGGDLCATVVGSPHLRQNPDQRDVLNQNASLRGRLIKGLRTMQVSPTGPGEWHKGWVYNPEDGKTYKAEVKLLPGAKLKVTGCIAKPLCQSQTWTRIGD